MASSENSQPNRKTINSYTIKKGGEVVNIKAGDDILLMAPDEDEPYVARVVEITADRRGKNVRIAAAWYYRPEDTQHGRRNFHGSKELYRSNHVDIQLPQSISRKCKVHTFEEYIKLKEVDETDFFSRIEYDPNTKEFNTNKLQVFCVCNLPWNPDLMIVGCDGCKDWYHPECLSLTREEFQIKEKFICFLCKYMQAMMHTQSDELADERPHKRPRTDNPSPSSGAIPDDDGGDILQQEGSETDNVSQIPCDVPNGVGTPLHKDLPDHGEGLENI